MTLGAFKRASCPACGARLPIVAGQMVVQCEYCGARSYRDDAQGDKKERDLPVVHVEIDRRRVWSAVLQTMLVAFVVASVVYWKSTSTISQMPKRGLLDAAKSTPQPLSTTLHRDVVFTRVNADDVDDVLTLFSSDNRTLIAVDGETGEPLWKMSALKQHADGRIKELAVLDDLILVVGDLGQLEGRQMQSGELRWSVSLSEKIIALCSDGAFLGVVTTDEKVHRLSVLTGKHEGPAPSNLKCTTLCPSTAFCPTPSRLWSGFSFTDFYEALYNIEFLEAVKFTREWQPVLKSADLAQPRVIFSVPNAPQHFLWVTKRAKGTPVPYIARVSTDKKILWQAQLALQNPLRSDLDERSSRIDEQRFYALYTEGGSSSHLAAFDVNSGKRAWDVEAKFSHFEVHKGRVYAWSSQFCSKYASTDEGLRAYDAVTGQFVQHLTCDATTHAEDKSSSSRGKTSDNTGTQATGWFAGYYASGHHGSNCTLRIMKRSVLVTAGLCNRNIVLPPGSYEVIMSAEGDPDKRGRFRVRSKALTNLSL